VNQRAITLIGLVLTASAVIAADSEIPRTASGKPDLSGNYDISSLTPFQRPRKYGEQLFLTREEAETIAKGAADYRRQRASNSDPNRKAPPLGANVGDYNYFWYEFGKDGFAIDGKFRTSILTDPSNGRMPALTDHGKARRVGLPRFAWQNKGNAWWLETGDTPYDGPETMVLGIRCIYQPTASVPIRPLPYNNLKTIVQTDDHVVIHIEWMHWARIVRIDSAHLPAEMRSLSGDSIGWWEDDVLVVETTNFLASPGVPRQGLRVVERLSPIDAKGLLYQFTVEDPDYKAPYSGELLWPKTEQHAYEYACHEGNYAMGTMLRGARLQEKEWLAKKNGLSGPKNR
jgi:hypothetical protein|tara:strand:- start:42 stop:1073 length:1032 start_codon:yes stop_codon:yes gene_type:complete